MDGPGGMKRHINSTYAQRTCQRAHRVTQQDSTGNIDHTTMSNEYAQQVGSSTSAPPTAGRWTHGRLLEPKT